MTELDLTRLWELHAKATPAPWRVSDTDSQWIVDDYGDPIADTEESESSWTPSNDAALIAEMRNALPGLLDALDAAEAEVERQARQLDAESLTRAARADYPDVVRNADPDADLIEDVSAHLAAGADLELTAAAKAVIALVDEAHSAADELVREMVANEKHEAKEAAMAEYCQTHSRDGYALGTPEYPDNREGRRALARTWKRTNR